MCVEKCTFPYLDAGLPAARAWRSLPYPIVPEPTPPYPTVQALLLREDGRWLADEQSAAEVLRGLQPRCRRDVAEVQPGDGREIAEVQPGDGREIADTAPLSPSSSLLCSRDGSDSSYYSDKVEDSYGWSSASGETHRAGKGHFGGS